MNCELSLLIVNDKNVYSEYVRNERRDCGYDLYTDMDVVIPAGGVGTLTFGIKCEAHEYINGTKVPISYFLLPRSSISNTPLMMCNSIGLIDSGYRGLIMAKVRNMSNEDYTVKEGTRLFQLAPMSGHGWVRVHIVPRLTMTERGEGGFGSTGK